MAPFDTVKGRIP